MSRQAEQLATWLADRIVPAWTAEGQAIVTAKQADLNTPAAVRVGPRSGRYPVASRPGEFPRRRTGTLRAGVRSDVTRSGDDVTLTISDPVPYAVPLQVGLQRVVLSDVPGRFASAVAEAAARAING